MSFTDRLVLSVHIAFVIFTIGPVTAAIMSTPRAIRTRNAGLLRYLVRTTRIFAAASLGILVFGLILGESEGDLSKAWLTVSTTLFAVALVLLVLIMRDQRRALAALTTAAQDRGAPQQGGGTQPPAVAGTATAAGGEQQAVASSGGAAAVATVERGRIASLGGIVSLIWLVILVLMVWQP